MAREPDVTSRMMSAVRSRDTRPELAMRRELHRLGLRFRLHSRDVVGTPDLVWRGLRVAVFVDGDFWHGNAWRVRGLRRPEELFPTNTTFWIEKIAGNVRRDEYVNKTLAEDGWEVVRIWESEIGSDLSACCARVVRAVDRARRRQADQRHCAPEGHSVM